MKTLKKLQRFLKQKAKTNYHKKQNQKQHFEYFIKLQDKIKLLNIFCVKLKFLFYMESLKKRKKNNYKKKKFSPSIYFEF